MSQYSGMVSDFATLFILGANIFFYALLLAFTIHAVFIFYHWFTYGTSKGASLVAFAIYLLGGAFCFLTMAISLAHF